MVQMTVSEAVEAMAGELVRGDSETVLSGVALDSRKVEPGQVFFALEGEQTDGHRFVGQALAAGAAAAVVREPVDAEDGEGCLIRVDDTFEALHDLVRHVRVRTPRHLVAITGSAGKTTTKELLALMLARRFRTAANPGNLNNLYGFPVALLGIPDDTEWMVAEMGMSTPGELGGVSRLGRPEIALFLNVRHCHVEAFEDEEQASSPVDAIMEAKAELLQGLDPDGLVIVNAADPRTLEIGRRHLERGGGRLLGFSLEPVDADIDVPIQVEIEESSSRGHRLLLTREADRVGVEMFLPLHGLVNVENFLAAATCANHLGVDLEVIAAAVAQAHLPEGRGIVRDLGGVLLVDDSYNSNPSALEEALRAGAALRRKDGRLWAVLGEMKELGSDGHDLHREAGELAGALGYTPVVGVGEMARDLLSGASDAGSKVRWFEDAEAAAAVAAEARPGDVILVKGSRSVGLEHVVAAFRDHLVGGAVDSGGEG